MDQSWTPDWVLIVIFILPIIFVSIAKPRYLQGKGDTLTKAPGNS